MNFFSGSWPSKWAIACLVGVIALLGWASIETFLWMIGLLHDVIFK